MAILTLFRHQLRLTTHLLQTHMQASSPTHFRQQASAVHQVAQPCSRGVIAEAARAEVRRLSTCPVGPRSYALGSITSMEKITKVRHSLSAGMAPSYKWEQRRTAVPEQVLVSQSSQLAAEAVAAEGLL